MTDLIERPAPLRAPVNSYDPNVESFTEDLHDTIRRELSTIGKVYDIKGTMLHTRRHGMVAENVKAYIEHPRFCIPIIMDISWDGEKEKIVYRNALGHQFTPRGVGYGDDVINDYEKEIFTKALSGVNSHPAITTRTEWQESAPYLTRRTQALIVSAPGATTLMGSGGYVLLADPTNLLAMASVPVMVGAGVLGNIRMVRRAKKQHETHRQAVKVWNEDRKAVLMSTMSLQEQSIFMDALLTLCDHVGIQYRGKLAATTTNVTKKHVDPGYDDLEIEPRYNLTLLRGAAIRFEGIVDSGTTSREIIFDGEYFYVPNMGNKEEARPTTISPL